MVAVVAAKMMLCKKRCRYDERKREVVGSGGELLCGEGTGCCYNDQEWMGEGWKDCVL